MLIQLNNKHYKKLKVMLVFCWLKQMVRQMLLDNKQLLYNKEYKKQELQEIYY